MNKARGKLKHWNVEKGYGFIRPDGGGKDVFVHMRDIGIVARPPRPGDVVQYQVMSERSGRIRAGDVHIEGLPRQVNRPQVSRRSHGKAKKDQRLAWHTFAVLIVVGLGFYVSGTQGVRKIFQDSLEEPEARLESVSGYRCEGKQYCSEMSSCEEAMFYVRNCPNTKMDGDRDGVPCESQWCLR